MAGAIHYNRIRENYPQLLEDPECAERFALARSTFRREEPVTTPSIGEAFRSPPPDAGLSEFTLPGAVLRQVPGRWEASDMYGVAAWKPAKGSACAGICRMTTGSSTMTESCVRFHTLGDL